MHLQKTFDHLPFAGAYARHGNRPFVGQHAELSAPLEIGRYLRTVDHVLARQTRYVRAGTSQVLALDGGNTLTASAQVPGHELPCFSCAQHNSVVLFVFQACSSLVVIQLPPGLKPRFI